MRFRGEYVPLNVVGDGTRLLLLGVAALSCLGADLIILDDPEVHLHPGYMDVLSRCVVRAAKDGSQVFISTHSIEIIDRVLEAVRGRGLEGELRVLRMKWIERELKVETMDYKEAIEEHEEIQADLRIP